VIPAEQGVLRKELFMNRVTRYSIRTLLVLFLVLPAIAAINGNVVSADCQETSCEYGQGCYSQGACHCGQRCSINGEDVPTWVDDDGCPAGCE